jgi:outer membrane lipoprotein LolB
MFLAGCTTPVTSDNPPLVPAAQAGQNPTAKAFSGRLGLQFPNGGNPSVQLGFTLQGNRTQGQLLLETPFGTTVASVQWNAQFARLSRGDTHQHFPSLDALLAQELGSELPLDGVFAWLNGQGTVALTGAGWLIEGEQAQTRLRAYRASPAPAIRLTLVLDPPA